MGDVSEHFYRAEFACRCQCNFEAVDVKLLRVLERIRCHFGEPLHITSGCRCEKYNKEISGSENSQHVKGMAADIWLSEATPKEVADYADEFLLQGTGGIGIYDGFTHIDVRSKIARWNYRRNDDTKKA